MQPLMSSFSSACTRSSSSSASRAPSSAKSGSDIDCGLNDTPFTPVQTVLSSNQSTPPVMKDWCQRTPLANSRFSREASTLRLDARTQLVNQTILSGIPSLVSNNGRRRRAAKVNFSQFSGLTRHPARKAQETDRVYSLSSSRDCM